MGGVSAGGGAVGQSALGAQTGIANNLSSTGAGMVGTGQQQLGSAGKYFSTLASGNRAATATALAPAVGNINSVYGGTARTLNRFTRGPDKTVQMAETERERAGQVSSLFRDAPGQANQALATLGANNTSMGIGAQGTAAGIFGGQAGLSQNAQIASNQSTQAAGSGFGGLLFNLLKTYGPAIAAPATGGLSLAAYGAEAGLS